MQVNLLFKETRQVVVVVATEDLAIILIFYILLLSSDDADFEDLGRNAELCIFNQNGRQD